MALTTLLLGSFVFAQAKVQSDYSYQRQNWSAVAAALGRPSGPRAIVAPDDGAFATVPLTLYLRGSSEPGSAPVSVRELDVVVKELALRDPQSASRRTRDPDAARR